jgi:hypothetical protein
VAMTGGQPVDGISASPGSPASWKPRASTRWSSSPTIPPSMRR